MTKLWYFLLICIFLYSCSTSSLLKPGEAPNQLDLGIKQYCADKKAEIGVSVLDLENGELILLNNDKHYPMQSVFKFPLVLAVLHEVDNGILSLDEKVEISETDLLADTWSPIRDTYLKGQTDFTLADVIRYTISQSDNNGCDILLNLIGGTEKVDDYIHKLGITDIQIGAGEAEIHDNPDLQYTNWSTPEASVKLLKLFYNGEILKKTTYDFLWDVMEGTTTGGGRIKGNLPEGTQVAHKTGTSAPPGDSGITVSINDIGIVSLPDNRHFAICVFVSNSKEDYKTNEKIIADISELAWKYSLKKARSGALFCP